MGSPVEARSLSNLNYLLANPPQYPRNPTHEIHKPLVLYIVRVPGSKDVFLTPLKPATKTSISFEAIQTSLYYLHVNNPEDENVQQSVEREFSNSIEKENSNPSVHRKPLPSAPYLNYPASQRPPTPSKSYPDYQPALDGRSNASQLERFAHRGSNIQFGNANNTLQNSIARKPLGPRRFQSLVDTEEANSDYHAASEKITRGMIDAREVRDDLAVQPLPRNDDLSFTSKGADITYQNITLPKQTIPLGAPVNFVPNDPSSARDSSADLSVKSSYRTPTITLIRRDPTSGAQWNIGTIQLNNNSIIPTLRSISIHLDTPGYHKFDNQQEVFNSLGPTNPDAIKEAMASAREKNVSSGSMAKDAFTRVVEFRKKQFLSSTSLHLPDRGNSSDHVVSHSPPNRHPKSVFSFLSPWQGLCVFSNSIDGRSLKCRHTINSLGPSSDTDDEKKTATVAELRFNLERSALHMTTKHRRSKSMADVEPDTLPISELLKERPGGRETLRKGFRHLKTISRDLKSRRPGERQHLDPSLVRATSSQNSEEDILAEYDPNRLSLKLGREKAGGGYRGKSAKLGKLIIENEGLKMGDLAVAACMGVWWQHYDHCEQ